LIADQVLATSANGVATGAILVQAGDIALHLTPWQMAGVGSDGKTVTAGGSSVGTDGRGPRALLRSPAL